MIRTIFSLFVVLMSAGTARAEYDVVVVGATPGGIMASIAAARGGCRVLLLDRNEHIGGLPANGLGATDIGTRGATGGLFLEFVGRIRSHYVRTNGEDSQQVKDCSDGYHFEPSVAENIFKEMLEEHKDRITVLTRRQFDAKPGNVTIDGTRLARIVVTDRDTGKREEYAGKVFIDATYEGDLSAAAGVPFRIGREDQSEFNEPCAGKIYKPWGGNPSPASTGKGDDAVQSYNYRLCLTKNPADRIFIEKPANYNRDDYASIIDDVKLNRWAGKPGSEIETDGIGRVVNIVILPNGKTDANNQHLAFVSTDLPEENWKWPTADWAWRDAFAQRLRDYTLGLLWFVQNDPDLPDDFREKCRQWGLSKSEYADNGNFPRQAYVREGRRMEGMYLFTAHDALPVKGTKLPPVHPDAITASHYNLDSHAVHKREPGMPHLDGFFSYSTKPYTVPYGVMVPKKIDGLLMPVPASATHVGFSTLRMEPCWMALGQASGVAAAISIDLNVAPRNVDIKKVQKELLKQGAILKYPR